MNYADFEAWALADYGKAHATVTATLRRLHYMQRHGVNWEAFEANPHEAWRIIRAFIAQKKRSGSSPGTIRNYQKATNWVVDYCNATHGERWARWKLEKPGVGEKKVMRSIDVQTALNYTYRDPVIQRRRRFLIWLARYTGLRPAEYATLRVRDLSPALSAIWLEKPAKGGLRRYIPLPREAWLPTSPLQEWLEVRPNPKDTDELLTIDEGHLPRGMTNQHVSRDFFVIGNHLGILCSATRFRRFHLQELDEHNVNRRCITYAAGHNKGDTTDHYLETVSFERVLAEYESRGVPGF